MTHRAKLANLLFLQIKFYWHTALLTRWHVAYGRFLTTVAEWRNCDSAILRAESLIQGLCWPQNQKYLLLDPLQRELANP